MSTRSDRIRLWLPAAVTVFCLALVASGTIPAQRQGARAAANRGQAGTNLDPLTPLKNALQAAEAPALTAEQETRINAMIAGFRASVRATPQSAEAQAARLKYDEAILAGDMSAIAAQITLMVNQQISQSSARMNAEAAFSVGVVWTLSADQKNLLQKHMGSGSLVAMVQSLSAGAGRGAAGPGRSGQGRGQPRTTGLQGTTQGTVKK